jgi:hypothetical protein
MRRNRLNSKNTGLFLPRPLEIGMTQLLCLAVLALGMAASLYPETARAQEYPWCVTREGYLYCFYSTQQQCQWTASGIGGCALNPRLLFPEKPRDSGVGTSRSKDRLSRVN